MSEQDTPSLRKELEVRVIAFLTDELTETDAQELEKILAVDEELSAFRDRMASLMGDIHAARGEISPPPFAQALKLSKERRRAIFEQDKAVNLSDQDQEKKWWHLGLLEIAAMLLLGAFLAAFSWSALQKVRSIGSFNLVEAELQPELDALYSSTPQEALEGTPAPIESQSESSGRFRQNAPEASSQLPLLRATTVTSLDRRSSLVELEELENLGDLQQPPRLFRNDKIDEESLVVAFDHSEVAQWGGSVESSGSAELGLEKKPLLKAHDIDRDLSGRIETYANHEVIEKEDPNRFISESTVSGGSVREQDYGVAGGEIDLLFDRVPSDSSAMRSEQAGVAREYASSIALRAKVEGDDKMDRMQKREQGLLETDSNAPMAFYDFTAPVASPIVASVAKPIGTTVMSEFHALDGDIVNVEGMSSDNEAEQLVWENEEKYKSYKTQSTRSPNDPFASSAPESTWRSEGFVDPLVRSKSELNGSALALSGTVTTGLVERFGWDSDERDEEATKRTQTGKEESYSFNFNTADMAYEELAKDSSADERSYGRPPVQFSDSLKKDHLPNVSDDFGLTTSWSIHVNPKESDIAETRRSQRKLEDMYQLGYEVSLFGMSPQVEKNLGRSLLPEVEEVSNKVIFNHSEKVAIARNKNVRHAPKPEKQTKQSPVSTFSLNVSDVSFELAQAALVSQRIPSAELIRTEEFVNGFDYGDPSPRENEPVTLNWEIAHHPYQHNRQIVRFSLQTQTVGRNANQPLNLNLLVDNSGSMQRPDRRAILEKSLGALQSKLTDQDRLNVVLFARQPKLIASASNMVEQKAAVEQTLNYQPEGGTNLESGLRVAYNVAQKNYDAAANNRVILITDGAANLGEVDSNNLAQTVIAKRKQGIALDAYGIGWEDYNDALLEEITRNGDGRYAFLNDVDSATNDFADKLAGALQVSAADVKVQIIWNPERVKTYRQIGYDLHQLKEQDFRDNTVDAAEISQAESGTALYVIQLDDELETNPALGKLQVRYRVPSTGEYLERSWTLDMPGQVAALEEAPASLRLAASSALFAERLANNPYAADYSLEDIEVLANGLHEAFPAQSRVVELQNMIQSAKSLIVDNK